MSHELKARVLNVDLTKEMFDLWYEVTYLRFLLNQVINETPHLLKRMEDDEVFDDCRRRAQIYLKDKFKIDLEYTQPREEQDEKIND